MAENRKVKLKSSDGQLFEVDEAVAFQSHNIKTAVDISGFEVTVPVSNVNGRVLGKVIDYCKFHVDADNYHMSSEDMKKLNEDFIEAVKADQPNQATLFGLIEAANYLNIQSLLDLTCQTVADMMRGKSTEEIRNIFHIVNDFSPEEEEEVRCENASAFSE